MSRLPGGPAGLVRKADPDVYTVLLLIGVLLLLTMCISVYLDLTTTYGMDIGQMLTPPSAPQ